MSGEVNPIKASYTVSTTKVKKNIKVPENTLIEFGDKNNGDYSSYEFGTSFFKGDYVKTSNTTFSTDDDKIIYSQNGEVPLGMNAKLPAWAHGSLDVLKKSFKYDSQKMKAQGYSAEDVAKMQAKEDKILNNKDIESIITKSDDNTVKVFNDQLKDSGSAYKAIGFNVWKDTNNDNITVFLSNKDGSSQKSVGVKVPK